jgi:hypothetical protein
MELRLPTQVHQYLGILRESTDRIANEILRKQPIAESNILNSLDEVVKNYRFAINLELLETCLRTRKNIGMARYSTILKEAKVVLEQGPYALRTNLGKNMLSLSIRIRDGATGSIGSPRSYLAKDVGLCLENPDGGWRLYNLEQASNGLYIPRKELQHTKYNVFLRKK